MITVAEHQAASDAVGWEPPEHDIKVALEKWAHASLADMRRVLERSVQRLEGTGGRNVPLADEIDMLRIAIAVREVRANGK